MIRYDKMLQLAAKTTVVIGGSRREDFWVGRSKPLEAQMTPLGRAMKMKLVLAIITVSLIGMSASSSRATETTIEQMPANLETAENKQMTKLMNKIEPLPRDLEIQLALSALPPHLRDNATVYVLNPAKGFEVARKGTNGFHAFVTRTGEDTFRGSWPLTEYRDDILCPISFDKAGAKAQMRVFFDAAEMQANGTPPVELKKIIQDRHKTGYYKAPERAGISYMLAPVLRTYFNPEESDRVITINLPHVMYYAPGVSNEEIGAGELGGMYPFVILHGHHGYMIQPLGVTERAAINKEYEGMLARLCNIKDVWCLPKENFQ